MRAPRVLVVIAGIVLAALAAGCGATREIAADTFRVIRVVDGDTFVIRYNGDLTRVRFYSGDAPERGEPGFQEATDQLRSLIDGRDVRLVFPGPRKRDPWGRLLADVYLDGLEIGPRPSPAAERAP